MVGVVGGLWLIAVSELTLLNNRIFALGIDAWTSAGSLVASPAREGSLAVASALGIVPLPGGCLGVHLCWEHCCSLTSLHQCLRSKERP